MCFSAIFIVEILSVHGKDCTEREINAVDSEFQAGAKTWGNLLFPFACAVGEVPGNSVEKNDI